MQIEIVYRDRSQLLDLPTGTTVGDVMARLGVPPEARTRVDGQGVWPEYRLRDGDRRLEFVVPGPPALGPESEGLEPWDFGGIVTGHCEDIYGEGAVEVDFKPTRAELKTLCLYHLDRFFHFEELFAAGHVGVSDIREHAYAWRRFETIAAVLNPDGPIPEFVEFIAEQARRIEEYKREMERDDVDRQFLAEISEPEGP